MNQRLKYIFTIAALTAAGIIVFQVYWVFQTYNTGKRSFENTISTALQNSLDQYQLQRASLPSASEQAPYLAVVKQFPVPDKSQSTANPKPGKSYNVQLQTIKTNSENDAMVKLMMAKFANELVNKPVDLNKIGILLRKNLTKNEIDLPFKLTVLTDHQPLPAGAIGSEANFGTKKTIVAVTLQHTRRYLLSQNLVPAIISLVLVLLSAGSLWFMGVSILKQLRLNKIKDNFISNIAHELRTPIAVLKSTNEALYHFAGISNPEKANRYLEFNTHTLNKLDDNVERILDISRYEQGVKPVSKTNVDPGELVNEIKTRFMGENPPQISFSSLLAKKEVFTDRYMLETILSNLIDNAVKYATESPVININVERFKKGWQLNIADNGIGISEENLPLIFDKFYRVPSGDLHEVKGYGLGLSYVKQLITSLHGNVSVKSKPGEGSIFTIQFPGL